MNCEFVSCVMALMNIHYDICMWVVIAGAVVIAGTLMDIWGDYKRWRKWIKKEKIGPRKLIRLEWEYACGCVRNVRNVFRRR